MANPGVTIPSPVTEPVPFGKYLLLDRIAVGGMAEVFLATEAERPEQRLAIKRIRPHLSRQPAFVKMFLNEAKLAAQLNHPNIVQIHDLGKIGETYFIAMEHIFGRDMSRIIPKADEMGIPFPMVYALKIASAMCEGLYHAHQKHDLYGNPLNIVHRDVTPENIMVSFGGGVKVLDFGIAKAQNQLEQSPAGEIKGKLSYMSPEQCQGFALDQRSDLFSVGAMLYEWVTGYRLFTGDSEVAILKSITEGKIYSPTYFKSDIPEGVEAIVMRALEKDRDRRYQTAWDMQSDIDRLLAEHDFIPTNLHLANFLRQLFHDELDENEARIQVPSEEEPLPVDTSPRPTLPDGRRPTLELPAIPEVTQDQSWREVTARTSMPLPPDSPPDDQPTPVGSAGDERVLNITLTRAEAEQLEHAARRNGLSVPALARDILAMWLKHR